MTSKFQFGFLSYNLHSLVDPRKVINVWLVKIYHTLREEWWCPSCLHAGPETRGTAASLVGHLVTVLLSAILNLWLNFSCNVFTLAIVILNPQTLLFHSLSSVYLWSFFFLLNHYQVFACQVFMFIIWFPSEYSIHKGRVFCFLPSVFSETKTVPGAQKIFVQRWDERMRVCNSPHPHLG